MSAGAIEWIEGLRHTVAHLRRAHRDATRHLAASRHPGARQHWMDVRRNAGLRIAECEAEIRREAVPPPPAPRPAPVQGDLWG